MKKLYIIANWKSEKNIEDTTDWLEKMKQCSVPEGKEVIVCPSYSSLSVMKSFISTNNLSLKIGTQDISSFEEGAYTGAIAIKQVRDLITHVIVGHSERRKYFHETDEEVIAKIKQVLSNSLTPILCISDMKQLDYYLTDHVLVEQADTIIFVYEPPSAISGGGAFHAESPEVANENAGEISKKIGRRVITLYGGSIHPENAKGFFQLENIDGGLIGQASLDALSFRQIIENG